MNERIKELIKQATVLEDDELFVREVFDREKFAELIIEESCELMRNSGYRIARPCDFITMIEEHFGVEE